MIVHFRTPSIIDLNQGGFEAFLDGGFRFRSTANKTAL